MRCERERWRLKLNTDWSIKQDDRRKCLFYYKTIAQISKNLPSINVQNFFEKSRAIKKQTLTRFKLSNEKILTRALVFSERKASFSKKKRNSFEPKCISRVKKTDLARRKLGWKRRGTNSQDNASNQDKGQKKAERRDQRKCVLPSCIANGRNERASTPPKEKSELCVSGTMKLAPDCTCLMDQVENRRAISSRTFSSPFFSFSPLSFTSLVASCVSPHRATPVRFPRVSGARFLRPFW